MSVTLPNVVRPHPAGQRAGSSDTDPPPRGHARWVVPVAVAYVVLYGLGQASTDAFRTPEGVSVWFPPAALTFLLLVAVPPRLGVPVALATRITWSLVLAPGPSSLVLVVTNAVLVVTVYAVAARWFRDTVTDVQHPRPSPRSVAVFGLVAVAVAPLVAASATRVTAIATGRLAWADAPRAIGEFWIGDAVAIATLVPAAWAAVMLARAPRRTLGEVVATAGVAATLGVLATTIEIGGSTPLYLVLVPMVVAAVRHALPGAALTTAAAAGGLTLGLTVQTAATTSVPAAHAFLVVAALAGATVGSVEGRRRSHLEQLLASEHQIREMIDAVRDCALYRLDADGFVATWNEGARRLKGWAYEEIVGQHLGVLHTPESRAAGHPDRLLERARRDGVAYDEGWRLRRDGSAFWAEVTLTPIGRGDAIVGFTKVTRDVTARKQAEERLARRTRQLAASNEELDRFASVASHDLQEPLRMVTSYSRLFERRYGDQLDAQGRQLLDHVVDGARRMRSLINDLLTYSRLQTRDQTHEDVDLEAVLRDVRQLLAPELHQKGGRIVAGPLPTVRGARERLHAVLQNLVQNSLKYRSDVPPVIEVDGWQDAEGWHVTVSDNGEGIPEHLRDVVFEPFRRLHTRDEVPGTGIGLAICRRVVDRQGGWIRAEGNALGGTTIHLWLPHEPPTDEAP